MKVLIKIGSIILDVIIVFVFIITCYLVYYNFRSERTNYVTLFGIHFDVCETNSMEPSINVGDLVVSKRVKEDTILEIGDIVTYNYRKNGKTITITHRIVDIEEEDGEVVYITQGDNREVSQITDLGNKKDNILGAYLFRIPKVGYVVDFLKTKVGFFFCVLIPIILIIVIKILEFIKIKPKKITNDEKEQIILEYLNNKKE